MADTGNPTGVRCAVCGFAEFVPFARRSDGVEVIRCTQCGMGIIDPIPDDLMALYGDDYYGVDRAEGGSKAERGYTEYAYTAEHSVSWAAALVKLLFPAGGRILDIGCADGHLLAKLDRDYTKFGIEANEATGQLAAERGVVILGRDLTDPTLIDAYSSSFDMITAIAVFEHLRDIRAGMEAALRLLRDDGVLLFEVPLISDKHDNAVWLTSSLEHVWYPSQQGLQQLVESELHAQLTGTEVFITGYASTYIGLVFRNAADGRAIRKLAARVLLRQAEPGSTDEAIARMLLHLVHAATATHADLAILPKLSSAMLNPQFLRRLAEQWQADLWKRQLARDETTEVQARVRQLKADLDAAESDRVRSHTEITTALVVTQARLATAQTDLAGRIAKEFDLDRQRVALDADRAALDAAFAAANVALAADRAALDAAFAAANVALAADRAALDAAFAAANVALAADRAAADAAFAAAEDACAAANAALAQNQALQSGAAWHVAAVLREASRRYPRVARQARRVARVLWWTVRGRLFKQLRFRRQVRAQLRIESSRLREQTASPPNVRALSAVSSDNSQSVPTSPQQTCVQPETGQPGPLLIAPERPDDGPMVSLTSQPGPLLAREICFPTETGHPGPLLVASERPDYGPAVSSTAQPEPLSARELCLMAETGHRPPLPGAPERPDDWPLVSVVIPSFNYGQFVSDAVDSVLAQTFKDLEVIVVEGGSADPVSRFVAAGLRRPRTRVLMQGLGHRVGANRNFGISQARGRYICCLDADDTIAPTYIEKAVFLLERHGYDVVSSALVMVGDRKGQYNLMEQPDLDAQLDENHVTTAAVFRRSFWSLAGGYRDTDPAVSGYVYEDWAFWVRLAALGARFRNLHHDPMLRYRVHHASLSRGNDVLPIAQQREMVRHMNRDVLQTVAGNATSLPCGTPYGEPVSIVLDRTRPIPQPPTLLLAMPFLILGGAERLLSAVVAHLVQAGWRVVITTTIETSAEHGDTTPWFEQHTTEIFHLPRCLPPELWEDFVHHLVRSRNVDVVWVVGSAVLYDCLGSLRTAHPNLRVADTLFNTVGHTDNNRLRRDLIDLIFVETNEVYQWLLARGEDARRIRLVESGIDLAALCPIDRSTALMQQIGATSDDLIVGFSGRWSEEKNPLGYVEIARLVDHSFPVRFVMTGTGHQRPAIEDAIHEACFPDGCFHLLGEVPEIAPILASLDLLVVPSVSDGRPVVVLEALSLGVPVIASAVGALPDIVQDGRTGWLCEPNDLTAFAEHIERAERDRIGLRQMRHQAREYAEAYLDQQGMLAAYTKGLVSLLPEDRRSS